MLVWKGEEEKLGFYFILVDTTFSFRSKYLILSFTWRARQETGWFFLQMGIRSSEGGWLHTAIEGHLLSLLTAAKEEGLPASTQKQTFWVTPRVQKRLKGSCMSS